MPSKLSFFLSLLWCYWFPIIHWLQWNKFSCQFFFPIPNELQNNIQHYYHFDISIDNLVQLRLFKTQYQNLSFILSFTWRYQNTYMWFTTCSHSETCTLYNLFCSILKYLQDIEFLLLYIHKFWELITVQHSVCRIILQKNKHKYRSTDSVTHFCYIPYHLDYINKKNENCSVQWFLLQLLKWLEGSLAMSCISFDTEMMPLGCPLLQMRKCLWKENRQKMREVPIQ